MMESKESFERFEQGLLRCASCCRELAKMLDAHEWKSLSAELLKMLNQGRAIYKSEPLTEMQVLGLVTKIEIAQKLAQQHSVH